MDKAQLPVNAELSLGADTQDLKPITKAEAIATCDVPALTARLRSELASGIANIPDELKAKKAWLCWRAPEINASTGKVKKVPVYSNSGKNRSGVQGSDSDLASLSTWEDALKAFNVDATIAGLGFACLPIFNVVALDVDHCVNNGVVREDTEKLTNLTYCEISPSGTGIRAFWLGTAIDGKNHVTGHELFSSKGFVTVTGTQVLNEYSICSVGSLPLLDDNMRRNLERLSAKSDPDKSSTSPETSKRPPSTSEPSAENSDPKLQAIRLAGLYERRQGQGKHSILCPFEELHSDVGRAPGDGDTVYFEPHFNGHSEGIIFCSHTHDTTQAEYWEAIGYNEAINDFDVVTSRGKYRLHTSDEIASLPPLQWRIKHVLPISGIGAIYGPSGSGKSFLVLDMLAALEDSRQWFGHITKPAPVVYVCLEGSAGLSKRIQAYRQYHDRGANEIHFVITSFELIRKEDVAALSEEILKTGGVGAVVCIDTLNQAAPGTDENSSADMGNILAGAKALQQLLGGLVLLVHHTGKNTAKGLRGHSSLLAALDIAIEVTKNGDCRNWNIAKAKDGQDNIQHSFKLEVVNLGVDDDGEQITSCVAVQNSNARRGMVKLSQKQQAAMSALMAVDNKLWRADTTIRNGDAGVHLKDWRQAFYKVSTAETTDARRKAFQRAREDLVDLGQIAVIDDVYYPVKLEI